MANHGATWARLREVARQRYPDDDLAAEAAARELFDAEETATYATDLDAQAEEQGILDTVRTATRLWGERREELRAEGSGVGLDDDLANLELPTDEEAAESVVEQRALMASFETQRHEESARHLMAAERRVAADELAASHQNGCQSAYLRNLVTVDEARAAAAGRRPKEDRARVAVERRL
jgi:hypothetical protein